LPPAAELMRLSTRLALIGLAVIAGTLAVVAFATYQIVDVSGRRAVDSLLRDELELLRADLPPLLPEDDVTAADMRRVALQYLAATPWSARCLTVITVGADTCSVRAGPEDLLGLGGVGELPEVEPGRIRTVDTREGPVRMLVTAFVAGGDSVGRATIAGSLE